MKSCGSCHILNRAGTKGNLGPDLDEAFRRSIVDGFGRDTLRGVVLDQITHPARVPKDSPAFMPAKLVEGKLAFDVAAYVASVASLSGKDAGRLATAVPAPGAGKTVAAKDGKLAMDADPNGQLAYISTKATAPPARWRSSPRTSPRPRTTSRSRAAASTRRARPSRAAASRRSPSPSRPASTRTTARCPATARAACWATSPSSSRCGRRAAASN